MPRPTTKQDLIIAAIEQYEKMWKLIDSMSEEKQNAKFAFEDRDKNLRDILVHLYEWQQFLLNWVEANQKGEKKPFLPEPYNFATYTTMNVELIWKNHQNTPYEKSKNMLKDSHKKVMELIDSFSNEELFAKKYFSWTGTGTLGGYCISTTSSHYNWAIKKIKKHSKSA
jgi:hypothetical protein